MKIKDANELFEHMIVEGSEYCWQCWPNARFMDYENEHSHASVVFSTDGGELYEATVTSKDETVRPWRWLSPGWRDAMIEEAKSRGIDPDVAWDDVHWSDCELWSDWADKAATIWRGEVPDNRVEVPLELSDADLLRLALEAHKQDITLNQLITNLLQAEIDAANALRSAESARSLRQEIKNQITAEPEDDRSTSDIEHSHHWYDTDRNR